MIQQAVDDILFETKIKPIGQPEILQAELGELTFNCELIFMKKPDFALAEYKGMEVVKPANNLKIQDVAENMMQELRLKHSDINPYDENDFVQSGDQITLDLEISADGKEIIKDEGQLYTVCQTDVFPEFDNSLFGMNIGETREFDVILPELFGDNKGKKAHVKVTVHMGCRKIPTALDDELAKKEGIETLTELRSKVEQIASIKVQQVDIANLAQQVSKKLIDMHDFKVPDWLALMEAKFMAANRRQEWEKLPDSDKQAMIEMSIKNVKLAFIFDSIQAAEPESVLTDNECVNLVKQRLQELNQNNVDGRFEQMKASGQLAGAVAALKNEYTLQWVVNQVKIAE
jgi:trigger factor